MGSISVMAKVSGAFFVIAAVVVAEPPQSVGSSTTSVSYMTDQGLVTFSGQRNYNGLAPGDATILGAAPNIRTFNSANHFGRRTELAGSHPQFAHIIGPNETLIAHAFFKSNINGAYFPNSVEGSDLTIAVQGIQFEESVTVVSSTFLFHTLWDDTQVDQLFPHHYHHQHNLHTQSDPFRDAEDFSQGGLFSESPRNYALSDVSPIFSGNGTDTLSMSVTIPYDLLKNLEEMGHTHVPPGLPAPHGFLEPFHFHFEYVVVPEPASCLLFAPLLLLFRRRPLP